MQTKQYLFVVDIFSKKNSHPLQVSANLSMETRIDHTMNPLILEDPSAVSYIPEKTDQHVIFSHLLIPEKDTSFYKHLPEFLKTKINKNNLSQIRNTLWTLVNIDEKRADSQFARVFSLKIPNFLPQSHIEAAVLSFAKTLTDEGMLVDINVRQKNNKEDTEASFIEAKFMCTTRTFVLGSFGNKNRDWNTYQTLYKWRKEWFQSLNTQLNLMPEELKNHISFNSWKASCDMMTSNEKMTTTIKESIESDSIHNLLADLDLQPRKSFAL